MTGGRRAAVLELWMTALDLVLSVDGAAFVKAARPLLADPAALDALLPDVLRETALRHYRSSYPKHVPHALLALLGGLDSRDLLPGPESVRPVLQALGYVCREKHSEPFPIGEYAAAGDETALMKALDEGDFPAAYGATKAVLAEGGPTRVRDTMLLAGSGDRFNLCHRQIYAAKVLERLDADPRLDAKALLFPVVHYLCLAPRDPRHRELLGGNGTLPRGGDLEMPGTCLEAVRKAAATGDTAQAITVARKTFGRGSRPDQFLELVFLLAVRRLATASGAGWIRMAHVANLAETSSWWIARGGTPDRFRAAYHSLLFLTESIGKIGPGETPETARDPDRDPARLLPRLMDAIVTRDEAAARSIGTALEEVPGAAEAYGRTILRACARIDGKIAFGHDVKVTASAVRIAARSQIPGIVSVLTHTAAFLARLSPGNALDEALFATESAG